MLFSRERLSLTPWHLKNAGQIRMSETLLGAGEQRSPNACPACARPLRISGRLDKQFRSPQFLQPELDDGPRWVRSTAKVTLLGQPLQAFALLLREKRIASTPGFTNSYIWANLGVAS